MSVRGLTPAGIKSRLARGFGRGTGLGYKSFIPRRAGRSRGELTEGSAFGSGRQLLQMSRGERRVSAMLWWDDGVKDVLEGYPLLPLEETQGIAASRGIRFPRSRKGLPIVRTMDFLVDHASLGTVALSRKDRHDAGRPRTLQLLQIERDYAHRRGWLWAAVTEDDVDETFSNNLFILNEHWLPSDGGAHPAAVEADALWLISRIRSRGATMRDVGARFDLRFGREKGGGLSLCWHELAHKRWHADLSIPLDPVTTRPRPGPPAPTGWLAGRHFL